MAANTTIQITFSGAASASSVDAANIKVASTQAVVGTVAYNASTDTATFTPSQPLAAGTKYTVTVSGVTSSSGTALTAFTSSFTTAAQSSASGGSSTLQYQATLEGGSNSDAYGQVTVNTAGNVNVELKGGLGGVHFTVEFCPAFLSGNNGPNCFDVGSLTSDANGNGTMTTKFPKAGSWAGDFQLTSNVPTATGGTAGYATDVTNASGQVYMSTMQPITKANQGTLATGTQAPLKSGTVTFAAGSGTAPGTLKFVLTGGEVMMGYQATENGTGIGGSGSYELYSSSGQSVFTTDSSGDVTFTEVQDGVFGDLFVVDPNSGGAGYVGGFSVP